MRTISASIEGAVAAGCATPLPSAPEYAIRLVLENGRNQHTHINYVFMCTYTMGLPLQLTYTDPHPTITKPRDIAK
jgi:hypothetical protein